MSKGGLEMFVLCTTFYRFEVLGIKSFFILVWLGVFSSSGSFSSSSFESSESESLDRVYEFSMFTPGRTAISDSFG